MGNFWSSSCGDKHSSIVQPKLFGKLPEPYALSKIAPELLVYTRREPESDDFVTIDHTLTADEAIQLLQSKGTLDDCQRLVVLAHGFLSSKETEWLHELKDLLLRNETELRQAVAILGWGGGADIGLLKYGYASANSIAVGGWLGKFLAALREARPDIRTYGVGHSLGAHLMGAAGRTSKALDRITGLDPAGVGFQEDNIDKRLNRLDAPLVDVIHTDGQEVPYFGTLVPLGLIDFYPNYGWNQPTNDRKRNLKPELDVDSHHRKVAQPSPYGAYISDSHGRAIDFFKWSVTNSRAFRTNLRLDGEPDVESAVHRVVATGIGENDAEISLEMGYHCDRYLYRQIASRKETSNGMAAKLAPDAYATFDPFAGCFYVHTNGTPPWS